MGRDRDRILAVLVVGVALIVGASLASVPSFGPATDEPTATARTTPVTAADPAFTFRVLDIEECGLTCRNVTGTLTNVGGGTATNVTVTVTLYAADRAVWSNSRRIGRLAPNESHVATENVTVDLGEATAIQENDGYVTIEIVVTYDGGSQRIETRQSVV